MDLTHEQQQFLITANSVAAVHDYFHWRVVGSALKWPEMKALRTLRVLNDMALVSAERGEEARMLPAGRQLAHELLALSPGKVPQPSIGDALD